MQYFGVRNYKVSKVGIFTRLKRTIISKKMSVLIVLVSLLCLTFLGTTVCYQIELNKYDNNTYEKYFKKQNYNIDYYFDEKDVNISKDSAASNLVGCIKNSMDLNNLDSSITNIVNELNNLFNENSNYFSFIYKDIYTGFTVSYNENSSIFTASSIKAPAMIYIYEKASEGEIDLNEELIYDGSFYSEGSGVLKDKERNTAYTIDTLIGYTIHDSDNIAYAMLVNRFGRENIYNFWKEKGCQNIFKYDTIWGSVSANDAAIYMTELYNFYQNNDEYGNKLMEYFKNAEWKQITDKDGKYNTANKGGWANGAFHDIAIVFDENPYILAIYSNSGNDYGEYKYLFNKTSTLVGNMHNNYWKYKVNECSKIKQY